MSRRERREREEREAKERKRKEKEDKKKSKIEKKLAEKRKKTNRGKSKKKKKKSNIIFRILKTILKIILITVLVICVLAGILIGYLGVKTNWKPKEMVKLLAKEATMIITGQTQEDIANLKPIYCLVLGVSEDIDIELTDTIMVCAYYPKTQQASILSIPRDTFVGNSQSTANGSDKVNSVYAANGNDPEATLEEVEELTGLEINNYIVVKTKALRRLVDEIGGVYFDVPINMKYDSKKQNLHINLKKGYQLVDGNKAEQLVRFRKNNDNTGYPASYGSDDYGRMKTQRNFIIETAKQTLQLKNVTKINELVKIVFDNVDTNLDMNEVLKYVPAAVEFNVENIKSTNLPGISDRIGPANLWFFVHNETETEDIVDKMFLFNEKNEGTVDVSAEDLTIQILNGSSENEKFDEIKSILENNGYNVISEGITTISKKSKIINRTNKSQKLSDEIIKIVGDLELINGNTNDYSIDYTIIVGQDIT